MLTGRLNWAWKRLSTDGKLPAGRLRKRGRQNGAISDTLTICVPPACFDAFWGWDAANVDVESLLISVLIAGMDPIALFDWFEPTSDGGFGLLPDCNETVETVKLTGSSFSSGRILQQPFQWKLPASWDAGMLQVFDVGGRTNNGTVVQRSWMWPTGQWVGTTAMLLQMGDNRCDQTFGHTIVLFVPNVGKWRLHAQIPRIRCGVLA